MAVVLEPELVEAALLAAADVGALAAAEEGTLASGAAEVGAAAADGAVDAAEEEEEEAGPLAFSLLASEVAGVVELVEPVGFLSWDDFLRVPLAVVVLLPAGFLFTLLKSVTVVFTVIPPVMVAGAALLVAFLGAEGAGLTAAAIARMVARL